MLPNFISTKLEDFRTFKRKLYRQDSFREALKLKLRSIEREFPDVPKVTRRYKLIFKDETGFVNDVEFRRSGDIINISMDWAYAQFTFETLWQHLIAHYYWYARCGSDIGPVTISLSDGNEPTRAIFGQCTYHADMNLLPDTYFFSHKGYVEAGRAFQASDKPWSDRSDDIIWRGSAFGCGFTSFDKAVATHPGVLQRIRLAHLAMDSEVSFKFIESYQTRHFHSAMNEGGFIGDRVPELSWVNHKYAIDIDGYTNAWSNFYIRLKLGCCVLKVDSDYGYRQWYYHKLQPYVHYVPVKADLSDLFSQIEWVKAHQKEAEEIATAGRMLADSMDFESESAKAAQLIIEKTRVDS